MRVTFFVLVLLHGFIHILGFVKAFGFRDVKELSMTISKPMGVLWLINTLLFLTYGLLFILNFRQSWIIGLVAVIISQILVFIFWKDARYGTILNMIALAVCLVALGSSLIQNEFSKRVKADFLENNTLSTDILTQEDMAHMPVIVQKYLHYTKSIGQPKVKNFKCELSGGMRSNPGDEYMKVHSVQYNFYQQPSRYFHMEASKMGLPAAGLHLYQNATATFQVKLLNWFNVVDAKGSKMSQGETVTLLNDMCIMAPATLIDKRIRWEELDDLTAKAIFKNRDIEISAILYFDEKGELRDFVSHDRFETDGLQYTNSPWSTPLEDYKMINGYLLPGKGKLIYHRPEGDFVYGELEVNSVNYNLDRF
jgi:hypothetical protein